MSLVEAAMRAREQDRLREILAAPVRDLEDDRTDALDAALRPLVPQLLEVARALKLDTRAVIKRLRVLAKVGRAKKKSRDWTAIDPRLVEVSGSNRPGAGMKAIALELGIPYSTLAQRRSLLLARGEAQRLRTGGRPTGRSA